MNILITGVSSGLGRELTINLLSRAHHVWGIARKESNHPSLQDLIINNNFIYTQCDIAKEDEVARLIEKIGQTDFNLDIVVLNAAIMKEDFIGKQFSYQNFKEIFEVNLFGAVSIIDKTLPFFQEKGKGVYLGISSLSVYRAIGGIGRIAYPASKSALNMVFEAFRLQLANPKIRFIIVNPGRMEEEKGLLKASYKKTAEKIIKILKKNKNIIDYPFLPSLITKSLSWLPDSFISKHILRVTGKKDSV